MLFTLTVIPQELIIQSLAYAVCKDRSNYLLFNLLLESYETTWLEMIIP